MHYILSFVIVNQMIQHFLAQLQLQAHPQDIQPKNNDNNDHVEVEANSDDQKPKQSNDQQSNQSNQSNQSENTA